ncbi:hypothetical protein [Phenylobacterium sp.]|uniref:hypothetical protein n=1 Tax=Phenylobacterium sp. TaxID=1871053 RepID=UPI00273748AA|nr:hypothetical protein [Phenylobacterium sp.]MDP3853608.1 hypothetical protein [Phenylobacterium sp.]
MTDTDWITVIALAIASMATAARAYLQSPRLTFMPNAPVLECLVYDLLAGAAGLRAWILYEGQRHASMSESFLAVALAAVAAIGLFKVLFYSRQSPAALEAAARERTALWPRL